MRIAIAALVLVACQGGPPTNRIDAAEAPRSVSPAPPPSEVARAAAEQRSRDQQSNINRTLEAIRALDADTERQLDALRTARVDAERAQILSAIERNKAAKDAAVQRVRELQRAGASNCPPDDPLCGI